jgi:hypothetical protein
LELSLKSGVAKILHRLRAWAGTTEPQISSPTKNLLLAFSSQGSERLNGRDQSLCAMILEILEVSAILNFAVIPEN